MIAAGAFGILSAAGITLGLAFLPFTAIVLAVIGAVTGVTLAITHWSEIHQALNPYLREMGSIINTLLPGV